MNEPTDEELAVQARECPLISAALATGDEAVIGQAMKLHPPSKCHHVHEAETA
jgi:hypothetical protein